MDSAKSKGSQCRKVRPYASHRVTKKSNLFQPKSEEIGGYRLRFRDLQCETLRRQCKNPGTESKVSY